MSIREKILALPYVAARRLSTREGFFTAGRMFALRSERALMLRLSEPALTGIGDPDLAPPVIGAPVPAGLTWVAVDLDATSPDELDRLLAAAHDAVRRISRRPPRSRNRRRRSRIPA